MTRPLVAAGVAAAAVLLAAAAVAVLALIADAAVTLYTRALEGASRG
ncbi:hypothetical protein [Sinomonas sp. ASV322]|nr:hypothetical protein [Sinomonas sp. ASV322]MDQ4502192.1 hypothetical protein [Sinomonas sp. ASV322]